MKKLYVGIGIPGSGKTSLLKSFAKRHDYVSVCPDEIREEMTGDSSDLSKDKDVWKEAYKRVREQLQMGNTIVFDSTFANHEARKEFIVLGKESGAERIHGVFFDLPLELAKERNLNRKRHVSSHIMEQMHKKLSDFPPVITEGFDSVLRIDAKRGQTEIETILEKL